MNITAAMRNAPPVSLESAERTAALYAVAWREDCYVYMSVGMVIYSRGPNLDHPKTEPTFVSIHPEKGEGMRLLEQHPFFLAFVLLVIALGVSTIDYNILKRESHQEVVYARPPMAAPCREPKIGEELRIWVDKRTSDTEGVRTCRVVPITGDDSPRKAWKKAMKL